MTRDELISLSGQVANGILSADSSIISKVFDRTMHKEVVDMSVDIAYEILKKIDDTYQFSNFSKMSD